MIFRQIYEPKLAQYAYLIGCEQSRGALIIDPQRDIDRYVAIAAEEGLHVSSVAETHIHADFLSGCREFAERYGVRVFLSDEGGDDWRYEWAQQGPYPFQPLRDGDVFKVGNVEIRALHTPGHTPEHLSFLVTDLGSGADEPMGLISGDFVFVGDVGRPDLLEAAAGIAGAMEPSARRLHASIRQFMRLPDHVQVWPGHGAGSACGKALGAVPASTVGYEKRFNAAIQVARRGQEAFVRSILEGQPEPPLYFARMKRDNKHGPEVLGNLPRPRQLMADELGRLAGRTDVAVLDTRLDRSGFMQGHLEGALYAPLNRSFNTVAGCYVKDDTPIYLIVDDERLEEAIRDLVRIGLDDVAGFATPAALEAYKEDEGVLVSIDELDVDQMRQRQAGGGIAVDVRRKTEYDDGHVPGALNVAHTRLLDRMDELPRDQELLVYCQTGARSAVAAAFLRRHGYDARYVSDWFDHWAAQYETERAEPVTA